MYDAPTWALRKVGQKHLDSFEMWYWNGWRRLVGLIEREEVLHIVKEERNGLRKIKGMKTNWMVIFCARTAL